MGFCLFNSRGLKIISSSLVAGDAKDKDISWFSPNGEKLAPNQQRISVVWNDDSSSTLTIYNADIDDAGIYKCVVTGEDGSESEATVNVKIFRKRLLHLLLYPPSSPLARKTRVAGRVVGQPRAPRGLPPSTPRVFSELS